MIIPGLISNGFENISIIFKIFIFNMILLIIYSYLLSKSIKKNNDNNKIKDKKLSFFNNMIIALKLPSYSIFMSCFFILNFSNVLQVFFTPLYFKFIAKIDKNILLFNYEIDVITQNSIYLFTFYILNILSSPIWSRISIKLGKSNTLQLNCILYSSVLIISYYFPSGIHKNY
jgi:hypothetical protein